jgi:hypothetical protein
MYGWGPTRHALPWCCYVTHMLLNYCYCHWSNVQRNTCRIIPLKTNCQKI